MKTAKNCVKDMVLHMHHKSGSGLINFVNWSEILKLWAIGHENTQKSRKRQVFVMPLKHVSDLMSLVNCPGTLKL